MDDHCSFFIGQRVVCVRIDGLEDRLYNGIKYAVPSPGSVYTIRNIYRSLKGPFGVQLVEIINPPVFTRQRGMWELGYRAIRFRPVTDISIFERMLKERELEDA